MSNHVPTLETVSAKDLLTRPLEPLGFTIADILPHGLFLLAGSAKVGKSWLALDMSCAVANGGQLWQFPAAQGEVLYLALEDNHKRLQERLNKVSPTCDLDTPIDVHFVTCANKLGDELAEQIGEFLDARPQTKLIVIDTLQYVRSSGKAASTYFGDYRDMDALRAIIADRKLTMLLITHTHKSKEADPLNRVVGSTGLTGAADGIFVLEKNKRLGFIANLSRDVIDADCAVVKTEPLALAG
jgi:RecA-family ATPase